MNSLYRVKRILGFKTSKKLNKHVNKQLGDILERLKKLPHADDPVYQPLKGTVYSLNQIVVKEIADSFDGDDKTEAENLQGLKAISVTLCGSHLLLNFLETHAVKEDANDITE